MSAGEALSRLSTGLGRDEQVARAATELPKTITKYPEKRPPWEPERWVSDRGDLRSMNGVADPIHDLEGGPRSEAVADHMSRFDPKRVLCQVEAIRKTIADVRDPKTFDDYYSGAVDYDSFRGGVEAAAELFIEALASIYAEAGESTP